MIVEVDKYAVSGTRGVLVLDDAHVRAASCRISNQDRNKAGAAQLASVVLLVVLDEGGP